MDAVMLDRLPTGISDVTPLDLLLIAENCFLCEALARMLEADPEISAVKQVRAAEAIALGLTTKADAVLLCTATEDPAAVRRLRRVAPRVPLIACGLMETEDQVIAWAEAGLSGYIARQTALSEFIATLRRILAGEQLSSPRIVAALLHRFAHAAQPGAATGKALSLRQLTRRERQIAELVAAERGDKDIARLLNISVATTKFHVHNLLRKLGVQRRSDVGDALPNTEPSVHARGSAGQVRHGSGNNITGPSELPVPRIPVGGFDVDARLPQRLAAK